MTTLTIFPVDAPDATNYIQSYVDKAEPGDTIIIPSGQVFMVNATRGIRLKSDITFQVDGVLQALPTPANTVYFVVALFGCNNVTICGTGAIRGERYQHPQFGDDSGFGIFIQVGNNIVIRDVTCSNCWGDGILVDYGLAENGLTTNVLIERVKMINNHRQGLTVGGVNGLIVRGCLFADIDGGAPGDGIDIEPNASFKIVANILIENNVFKNTSGSNVGIDFGLGTFKNITVQHNAHDLKSQPIWVGNKGKIDIPAWAKALRASLGWWSGYRYWGYPTQWHGP